MTTATEDPPPPPPVKRRRRTHPCRLYVRKCKGEKYQLRWWLTHHGIVNCGLFATEALTVKARNLIARVYPTPKTPLDLWRRVGVVLDQMRAEGYTGVPARNPLPLWVRRCEGGNGYYAMVKKNGLWRTLRGPFESPEVAHEAMAALLAVAEG